ncbi:hypothetical protein DM02DRAFT_44876 [Periconia macrospinosa]|uniref:Uncharacterized protein n=1 Tax=Periconia macrospinosa TaxID=97972 RepID=A0A2V1DL22_9PLEO|nr:hypothetical protein DM02DRAFT_44876 [Periconia macrospinosa]
MTRPRIRRVMSGWVETSGLTLSLDYHRFWERTEFVRDAIAKKDESWAEMLDVGWWLSPSMGEGYIRGKGKGKG